MKISGMPFEPLRFIVYYSTVFDHFNIIFADSECYHSEMELQLDDLLDGDDSGVTVVSGGFYYLDKAEDRLVLFGRSSTYGRNDDYINKAIERFKTRSSYTVTLLSE